MNKAITEDRDHTIIRVVHNQENPFVQIHRGIFEDPRLSWKAKGLMGYFLSRPDDWEIRIGDLVSRSTDGRTAVYNGLRELRCMGYVAEIIGRHPTLGFITNREYVVYEIPPENPETRTAALDSGFLDQAHLDQGNLPQQRIKNPNQELKDNNTATSLRPTETLRTSAAEVVVGRDRGDPEPEQEGHCSTQSPDGDRGTPPPDADLVAFLMTIPVALPPDIARELAARHPERVARVRTQLERMTPTARARIDNVGGYVRRAIEQGWQWNEVDCEDLRPGSFTPPPTLSVYHCPDPACGYEVAAGGAPDSVLLPCRYCGQLMVADT